MTTVTANTSDVVTIPAGQILRFAPGSSGTLVLGAGEGAGSPRPIGDTTTAGPYAASRLVYVTAGSTGASYSFAPSSRTAVANAAGTLVDSIGTPIPTRGASFSNLACGLGDSHVKLGFVFGSNAANLTQANGWIAWLQAFTSHQIWLPWGINNAGQELGRYMLAVSGTTTVDLINSQLPRAVALRAGWAFVSTGGNDFALLPNDSVLQVTNRIDYICQALANSGKRVVITTLPPRAAAGAAGWSSTGLSAPQIASAILKQAAVNTWLRAYALNNPSLVLVDDYWRLVDTASATGDPLPTMVSDGLHLSATASFIRGQVALAAIAGTFRPAVNLAASLADVYDATNNKTGNHAPNSTLQGAGGTAGTGGSGTVATSYTVDRDGGADTFVCTPQARADGLNGREQLIVVTGTGGKVRMYPTALIPTGNFSSGDYAFWEVDITVNSVGGNGQWQGPDLFSWMQGGAVNTNAQFLTPGGSEQVPATPWSGTLRTPINQTNAGTSSILTYPRINSVNGGNPSVAFRRPRYQKIDPTLAGLILPGQDF